MPSSFARIVALAVSTLDLGMRPITLALLLAYTICGCSDSRVLWRGDASVGDTLIVFPSATSFRAVGSRRAICVTPASDTMFGKRPLQLDVYLVRSNGIRDRLGWRPHTWHANPDSELVVTPDSLMWRRDSGQRIDPARPPQMRDDGKSWCAEDWEGPRYFTSYRAVAIRASAALRINEVRWVTTTPML
jgi:hypothetical protein